MDERSEEDILAEMKTIGSELRETSIKELGLRQKMRDLHDELMVIDDFNRDKNE